MHSFAHFVSRFEVIEWVYIRKWIQELWERKTCVSRPGIRTDEWIDTCYRGTLIDGDLCFDRVLVVFQWIACILDLYSVVAVPCVEAGR